MVLLLMIVMVWLLKKLLEVINKVLNRLSSDGSIDRYIIAHTEK